MLPALTPEAADFLARYLAAGEDLHAVLNLADPATPAASLLTALDFLNHPDITPWLAAYRATLAHARRHVALDALARSLPTTTDPTQLRLAAATILHFTRAAAPARDPTPHLPASAAPLRPHTGAARTIDRPPAAFQPPRHHADSPASTDPRAGADRASDRSPHPETCPPLRRDDEALDSPAPPDSRAGADRASDRSPDNHADPTLPDTDILPSAFASDPDPITHFTLLRRRDLIALAGQARAVPDG